MKSKWRYNVRLAERKGVTVRQSEAADLDTFNGLMAATGARDKFGVHAPGYYAAAFDLLTPGNGAFLLAEAEGRAIGAIVVGLCGDSAWYLWGASSNDERNRMPNHALQWAGIRWAKARGARRYDFWGIPDDVGKIAAGMASGDEASAPVEALPINLDLLPQHGLWGVYRFKQGFGGKALRYVGAWDQALQPMGHRLYTLGLALNEQRDEWPAKLGRVAGMSRAADSARPMCSAVHDRLGGRRYRTAGTHAELGMGEVKAATGWHAERLIAAGDGRAAACQPCGAVEPLSARAWPMRLGAGRGWRLPRSTPCGGSGVAHAPRLCFRQDRPTRFLPRAWSCARNYGDAAGVSAGQIQFKNTAVTDLRPDAGCCWRR